LGTLLSRTMQLLGTRGRFQKLRDAGVLNCSMRALAHASARFRRLKIWIA
jgi:hypothetical protein